ncbi:MAG: phage terminase large subunit [Nitrospira sp.]
MRLNPALIDRIAQDYRLTPATLAHKLDPTWIPADHLMYISARVASGIQRGGARIIISLPPRHGKSRLLSIGTSTWVLEKFPTRNVILSSYGADLSEEFSSKVRDQITRNPQLLKVRLRADSSRVDRFKTTEDGGLAAVGLGGAITGRGADVLFIDDYIKEIKEALSDTYRDYLWNWFTTTAMTRLEPNASVIIIATRWHIDDLIGRILVNFPGEWEYIQIPAIANENDLLGRRPGTALFPERYPIDRLDEMKRLLGSHFFAAVYQQDPEGDDSRLSNRGWVQITDELPHPEFLQWARVWDLAATDGGGDYTVGGLYAADVRHKNMYTTQIVRKQLSPHAVEKLVAEMAEKDGPSVPIYIEQEPGASGKALVEHYQRNVLKDYKVIPVPATKAKVTRAHPLLAGAEWGRFYLLRAAWNEPFLREFDLFGHKSDHDDQVDTAAIAWLKLIGKEIMSPTWGRTKKTAEDFKQGMRSTGVVSGVVWGRKTAASRVPHRPAHTGVILR